MSLSSSAPGFSGTVLASKLLKSITPRRPEVFLVERVRSWTAECLRQEPFPFQLNVPAGRLSTDAKDPLQSCASHSCICRRRG